MNISIFSCSLNPLSRSFVLAKQAAKNLEEHHQINVRIIDLRDYDLKFCGQPDARDQPGVGELRAAVRYAAAVLVAVPIYNFYVNAAAKTSLNSLVERGSTNSLDSCALQEARRATCL